MGNKYREVLRFDKGMLQTHLVLKQFAVLGSLY